jgi:ParB/RepB/Spo0J family partition protein
MPKTEKRKLSGLKPHSRQAELFGDLPDHELQRLTESLADHGLDHPVEILPDGTIVKGHQRLRAAEILGWKTIDVIVRDDLAEAGEAATVEEMIRDNLDRRQLGPIDIARCYHEVRRLHSRCPWDLEWEQKADLRDQLAARFGKSGRTLDRYRRLLKTPRVVQDAVQDGRLTLSLGNFVAGQDRETQDVIAERIAAGESPKKVVADYMPTKREDDQPVEIAVRRFAKLLERGNEDLGQRVGEIDGRNEELAAVIPALRKGKELLAVVIRRFSHK